jgi:Prokaryotic cytochrome b561
MTKRLHYGTTAKALHWGVVALLVVQYSIGWLLPDVHGGPPGVPMTWHISIGTVILALIVARFLWRLTALSRELAGAQEFGLPLIFKQPLLPHAIAAWSRHGSGGACGGRPGDVEH